MSDIKTLTDLKTEAFGLLTGLDPSQQPATEDLETIGGYVDPLLSQLAADEIVNVPNSDEIPVEYFLPIARLLANVCGPRYGTAIDRTAKEQDERELRRLVASRPTYAPLEAVYY